MQISHVNITDNFEIIFVTSRTKSLKVFFQSFGYLRIVVTTSTKMKYFRFYKNGIFLLSQKLNLFTSTK